MNCTQETYHRCLATVAPREVAAARANGAYAATWNSKKPNKTDIELRAAILDMIVSKPLTTMQIRNRIGVSKERMYAVMAKLEDERLVKSTRVVVKGNSQSQWKSA